MKTLPLASLLALAPLVAAGQTVVTTSGTVQGVTSAGVTKFLGIPYAEPPLGALRWARPVAKSFTAGTIDATLPRAACTQALNTLTANDCRDNGGQTSGQLVGSEDCLTLSVWRPAADAAAPRPVMVWIHGGAHVTGCAKDGLTEASDLAMQGTATGGDGQIVVALQYRLGPMGFFALPELRSEDPNGSVGNYGILDQIEGLRWVQHNIAAFGGDPSNVTIFGESAGGFSTYILLASPLTQDLFGRAITESGNYGQAIALEPGIGAPSGTFAPTGTAYGRGTALAGNPLVGCTDPGTRVACLRGKSSADVFSAWQASSAGSGSLLGPPATPAIDGYLLREQAGQMLKEGSANGRPLLVGANADEMTLFTITTSIPDAATYESLVRAQFGTYAGNILLTVYPAAAFPTPLVAYRQLAADVLFVCPSFGAGKILRDAGSEAHVYHFAYPPSSVLGAFHGSELFYVFSTIARLASLGAIVDAGDAALSDAMQTAWTSYARNGTPIATPAWGAFDPGPGGPAANGNVLTWQLDNLNNVVANTFTPSSALRAGRCAQLEALAPTLNGDLDSFTNDRDDCPFATNTDQADAGSVLAEPADGIGDACQCGDTNDSGIVEDGDVSALRNALAGGAPLSAAGTAKCRVETQSAACDAVDLAVLRRRLASLGPGIQKACAAANPA